MATDTEKPDTEEREKPGPAKRQRLAPNQLESEHHLLQPQQQQQQMPSVERQPLPQQQDSLDFENPEDEAVVSEEEDRREREKLRNWQICQVIRSFMDNTINHVLEDYSRSPTTSFQDPWYCLFRGDRMEDTAVSAAIRNHGLVRSLDLSQLPSLIDERVTNVPQSSQDADASVAHSPSEASFNSNIDTASTSDEGNWLDHNYDSDHQQDFLDRAVAEAIKKKGLSTLSVDYG